MTSLFHLLLSVALGLTSFQPARQSAETATDEPGAEESAELTPAMFVAKDEDTTVYLFGSMHMLPENVDWRTDAFDKALEEADAVYFEVPMTPEFQMQAAAKMMQVGRLPQGESLMDDLDEQQTERFKKLCAAIGAPAETVAGFKPGTAAVLLSGAMFQDMQLKAEEGVELKVAEEARKRKLDLRGFETLDEQVELMFNMPEDIGMTMLKSMLDDSMEEGQKELRALYEAWSTGDMDEVLDIVDDMADDSQALYDRLLINRNKNWVEQLDKIMDEQAGEFLVVVGAGHLPGDEGVVELLKKAGTDVERVQ